MQVQGIHYVAIIVSDYQRSKDFYVNQLGFRVLAENYRQDRKDYKLDLELNGCCLEIFSGEGHPERPSFPEACGLRHLAFRVKNIEEVIADLHARGIETEPVRTDTYTGEKMTFFRDPDGLPLELHE